MKSMFKMQDKEDMEAVLSTASYGTLALCLDNKPYSLPINFVKLEDAIYFHGAKAGRKMRILQENRHAAFSVVEPFSLIASYFSSKEALACPATHFFRSIMIEGEIAMVQEYEEKAKALEALMQKLQPEGGYKPLSDKAYQKAITATALFKLSIQEISGKVKLGQHLDKARFEMIITHLKTRGTLEDIETVKMMQRSYHDSL